MQNLHLDLISNFPNQTAISMCIHVHPCKIHILCSFERDPIENSGEKCTNARKCSVWWVRDFGEQKCISQLQKLIETSSLGFKLPNWPSQWICIETGKFHIWRGCHLTGVKNLPSHLVSILPHLSSMLQCFYVAPPKVSIWQGMEPKIIGKQWTYGQFCIQRVCHYGRCCVLSWKL